MAKSTVELKVEDDLKAGRLWKARDRLTGALFHAPASQPLLERLGQVYFEMGDLPAAWRFWMLTTRRDESTARAEEAFNERFSGAQLADVLRQIPAREPLDAYPQEVAQQLQELRTQAEAGGVGWPRKAPKERKRPAPGEVGWLTRILVFPLFVFFGPVAWLVGIGFMIYAVVQIIGGN
jgi:predicted Zn-dependent protease